MSLRSTLRHAVSTVLGPRRSQFILAKIGRARESRLRRLVALPEGRYGTGESLPAIRQRGDFTQSALTAALRDATARAATGSVDLPGYVRAMPGMSGQRYRDLINTLIGLLPDARYLEIGSWAGSTAAAALSGNRLTAVCIDNWSEFGGPRDAFVANIERVRSALQNFRLLESDFRQVDYRSLGSFNVFLFDGPHAERDQYDGLVLAAPALDDHFILIVDDWNWRTTRLGTLRAIADCGWTVTAAFEIRTTLDDSHPSRSNAQSDWHNGYFIAAIDKD
jgi:Methyltransferase domain